MEGPQMVGLDIGINYNWGFVANRADLTSETINWSADLGILSLATKQDPQTGSLVGAE
jgi:hypothetical protein